MNIGERLADSLRRAKISPRNLSAVTKVHYTTIYKIIGRNGSIKPLPVIEETLSKALDRIEKLVASGKLPLSNGISDKEKTEQLVAILLADND